MRRKHRRQSSLGVSIRSDGMQDSRRRASYASSWGPRDADYDPDEMSTRTGRSRPCSWGPIGEFFYRDSLSFCDSERSPVSHHECNFPKKKMRCLSVTPPKIRFSATVQTKPHATISSREIEIPAKLDISFSVQTISSLYLLKLNLVYIISSRNRQAKHQLDDRNVYSTM